MMARLDASLCVIILRFFVVYCSGKALIFDEYYETDWGAQHVTFLDERTEVQISIDQTSGGGGFKSKDAYGYGYFKTSLKIPKNSTGIATTFYLTSILDNEWDGNHDELDFELLGSTGPSYVLNTNIFAQDNGHKEQQFNLWFDPTSAFHDYAILWNSKQIVFYIDNTPIRVIKNNTIGANYPKLPMYVHASLWNGSQWLGSPDWSRGPFYANYRDFEICGCVYNSSDPVKCEFVKGSWNAERNWKLSEKEEEVYKFIKNKYTRYDYCKFDSGKNSSECQNVENGIKSSRRRRGEGDRAEMAAPPESQAAFLLQPSARLVGRSLTEADSFCSGDSGKGSADAPMQAGVPTHGGALLPGSAPLRGSAPFADLYWASRFWVFYVLFVLGF